MINLPRYFGNPASYRPIVDSLEELRAKYDLGEKIEISDNPYSSQAVLAYNMKNDRSEIGDLKKLRRAFKLFR